MNCKRYEIRVKGEFTKACFGGANSSAGSNDLVKDYLSKKMTVGKTGMSGECAKRLLEEEQENIKKDTTLQENLDEMEGKGITVIYRDKDGKPSLADHQIKGWIKQQISFLTSVNKYKEFKKEAKKEAKSDDFFKGDYIKRWVSERISFINGERFFPINIKGESFFDCRPLRAKTMMGERIALATSEVVPEGSTFEFRFLAYEEVSKEILQDLLERGSEWGLGQWANSGCGTFKVIEAEMKEYKPQKIEIKMA